MERADGTEIAYVQLQKHVRIMVVANAPGLQQ